MVFEL
jgi:hypothetical protein